MIDIFSVIILLLSIALVLCIAYLVDVLRLHRLIKDYNKRHPYDLKDVKKSTPLSMNKQLIDWLIEMFAKNSHGKSYYESWSNDWEAFKDEEETN